jgi:hypothetical protein
LKRTLKAWAAEAGKIASRQKPKGMIKKQRSSRFSDRLKDL